MAFAYFVPYIVGKNTIFINCSIVSDSKLKEKNTGHTARFAGFSIAAHSDVYFYDIYTKVDAYYGNKNNF